MKKWKLILIIVIGVLTLGGVCGYIYYKNYYNKKNNIENLDLLISYVPYSSKIYTASNGSLFIVNDAYYGDKEVLTTNSFISKIRNVALEKAYYSIKNTYNKNSTELEEARNRCINSYSNEGCLEIFLTKDFDKFLTKAYNTNTNNLNVKEINVDGGNYCTLTKEDGYWRGWGQCKVSNYYKLSFSYETSTVDNELIIREKVLFLKPSTTDQSTFYVYSAKQVGLITLTTIKNDNLKSIKYDDEKKIKEALSDQISSLLERASTFKHTFKKNDNGYYWYSTEVESMFDINTVCEEHAKIKEDSLYSEIVNTWYKDLNNEPLSNYYVFNSNKTGKYSDNGKISEFTYRINVNGEKSKSYYDCYFPTTITLKFQNKTVDYSFDIYSYSNSLNIDSNHYYSQDYYNEKSNICLQSNDLLKQINDKIKEYTNYDKYKNDINKYLNDYNINWVAKCDGYGNIALYILYDNGKSITKNENVFLSNIVLEKGEIEAVGGLGYITKIEDEESILPLFKSSPESHIEYYEINDTINNDKYLIITDDGFYGGGWGIIFNKNGKLLGNYIMSGGNVINAKTDKLVFESGKNYNVYDNYVIVYENNYSNNTMDEVKYSISNGVFNRKVLVEHSHDEITCVQCK